MSGLFNKLGELHQQRHEGRLGHRGNNDDDDDYDRHGSRHGRSPNRASDDDPRRSSYQGQGRDPSYPSQGQDPGRGYAPPSGPPPSSYGQRPYQRDDDRSPYQTQEHGRHGGYAPPPGPPPVASYGQGRDDDDRRGSSQRFQGRDDDDRRGPSQYQDPGSGYGEYAPPPGPPGGRSGFAAQGGLDRGDFASDADIDRMVASGEFGKAAGRQGGYEYGGAGSGRRDGYEGHGASTRYGDAGSERRDGYDGRGASTGYGPTGSARPDAYGYGDTSSERRDAYGGQGGPHRTQGYDEHANDYRRYDEPSGPPPGRSYQSQQSSEHGNGSGYGGGPDRSSQSGTPQTQGRAQYDSPQGPPSGRGQGNAPAGGFSASRDEGNKYGSGHGERPDDRSERRGEASSYYNQQSQDDRYAHLAGLAKEQGDDPELYRRATQGLHARIQQQQSRPQRKDDDDDCKEAYKKAYGEDDHAPMSADAIGAAAAMQAIKQTAAAGNAPSGGFQGGKGGKGGKGGSPSSNTGKAARKEEEEEGSAAGRGSASGGLQDKLMAMAMSQAGKLFDKKNGGSSGAGKQEDKAQAMQSAAANAMQLFAKYKAGKLDPSDMASVMSLAMKMM